MLQNFKTQFSQTFETVNMLSNLNQQGCALALVIAINYFTTVNSDGAVGRTCSGSNGILKYEVGKSYVYKYDSEVDEVFTPLERNKDEPQPSLQIKGSVTLSPLSECEFTLTLDEGVITTPKNLEGQEVPANKGTIGKSSVRIVMQNGVVEEVLSDPSEPSWSVNVKKAIVMMIQNKAFSPEMDKLSDIETSVFGKCLTEYQHIQPEKKYRRQVVLRKCGQSEGSDIIFQGVPYEIPLVINKPIFKFVAGYMECDQTVTDAGIISEGLCRQMGGAFMKSNLIYDSTMDSKALSDEELAKLVRSSTIMYDFSRSGLSPDIEASSVAKAKSLLASLTSDESNKAQVFIELKKAVKRISDLKQFNGPDIFKEAIHKKTFYDAVAEVTSDEGVELLAQLAIQGDLDTTTLLSLYTHMAFASRPGTKGMNALKDLVMGINVPKSSDVDSGFSINADEIKDNKTLSQLLLLGSSGFAHQYCKMVNPNCVLVPEYTSLVNAIAQHAKADGQEDIVRGAFHALGNLDALTPEAVAAIQAVLASDNSANVWLDFLALDAFRRDPCQGVLKESVRKMLGDSKKDEQVRIHAYLAVSKCIMDDDLPVIQAVFAEESSTVGPFIASHIRNIHDSSSPSRLHLKKTFSQINIPDNVASTHDKHRVSKFFEYSTFNEKKNLGFSTEATVIFVSGNPMPQFVSLNATADLHGRSFNFLEIGLSQRSLWSNRMHYPDEHPPNWWSLQRAISAKDSYYRIFGTTIGVGSLQQLHNTIQMSMVTKSLAGEEGKALTILDIIQPSTLLDEELTRPTITGLPLTYNLQANHFNSYKIEVTSGFENLLDLIGDYKAAIFDIKMNFKADSATTFEGAMGIGVDTPVQVGYLVEGKLDDFQNLGIELTKKDAETLDVKVNFPEKVISSKNFYGDLFSFEDVNGMMSKTRVSSKVTSDSAVGDAPKEMQVCDKGSLDDVLFGIVVCHQCRENSEDFPNPKECTFTVEKSSESMTGWDFKFIKKGDSDSVEIVASTPGSETPRVYTVKVGASGGDGSVAFLSSTIEAKVQAELKNEKYEAVAKFNVFETWKNKDSGVDVLLTGVDYSFTIEYLYPAQPDKMIKLLSIKTVQPKNYTIDIEAEMGELLKPVFGDSVKLHYEFEREFNEFEQKLDESDNSYRNYKYQKNQLSSLTVTNSQMIEDLFVSFKLVNGDFHTGNKTNQTQGYEIKVNYGSRVYDLGLFFNQWNIYEPRTYIDDYDGKTYSGRSIEDFLSQVKAKFVQNDGTSHEVKLRYGEGASHEVNLGHERILNATVDVRSTSLSDPINVLFKMTSRYENRLIRKYQLKVDGAGQTQANITISTDEGIDGENGNMSLQGIVKDQVEFSGHFSVGKETRIDIVIVYIPNKLTIFAESDIKSDEKEIVEKTKVIVEDKIHDTKSESDSLTIIDLAKRTITISSKSKVKEQIVGRFDLFGQLPEDLMNGKITAMMTFEDDKGKKFSGSINDTTASKDNVFTKHFAMDVDLGTSKPYTATWDFKYDATSYNPDLYDTQVRIQSDKRFTGEFMGPFDIQVNKEASLMGKGNVWDFEANTNITGNGLLEQETMVKGKIIPGATPDVTTITVDGFQRGRNIKDDFHAVIDTAGLFETGVVQHLKLKVDRTDLTTEAVTPLLTMHMKKTFTVHSIMDFKDEEVGEFTLMEKTTYKFIQLIKMHDNELIIFKEIKQIKDGVEESDAGFMIDVVAKVSEENHQTKLHLKSIHNLQPHCPMGNFNFTLSK